MGHDGVHSEFLKLASDAYLDNVAHFMNASFNHCLIPHEVLEVDINPTVKDIKGNMTESLNYIPVMQSSCFLKLFEMHIFSVLEDKMMFNSRQFGFKKGCSTADACCILKEILYEYTRNKNKAFVAFIDLSKAFDKVDHYLLGQCLIKQNISLDLILTILHYLRNQTARVCWKDIKGDYKYVDKGVRQGGIQSPFLFKLYIDDILNKLSSTNVGCKLGLSKMNVLAYADDFS